MGWFKKKTTCEDIGEMLANQCIQTLRDFPSGNERQSNEFVALDVVAHHLGVQLSHLPEQQKEEILTAFALSMSPNINSTLDRLINQRGPQYMKMINTHMNNLNDNNFEPVLNDIAFLFGQFCAGGTADGPLCVLDIRNLPPKAEASVAFMESLLNARNLVGASPII